jgi:hypothetical protein
MKKGILMLAAFAFALAFAIPSYSAVQNVKVGGDFTIYGAYRHDFSFNNKFKTNDFLQSSVRVWVSAQLSNNVSTMVRLINERDWGQSVYNGATGNSNGNITLDLAYVKIADLITPGLNLTIGRQDLKIGQGFVIGSQYNALNYNTGMTGFGGSGGVANLLAPDLGLQQSFDAIKLDYATPIIPLSAQGFFAKVNESNTAYSTEGPGSSSPNDVNLLGLSVLYAPSNWSLEPYVVNEYNYANSGTGATPALPYNVPDYNSSITTAGLRGTLTIPAAPGLSFKGEYAKQFGTDEFVHQSYEGWAGYLGGKYVFQTPMKPYISAEYSMYSGQTPGDAKVKAWQPMYPSDLSSQFGAIGYPAVWTMLYGGSIYNGLTPTQYDSPYYPGIKIAKIGVGFQPLQKLGVFLNYYDLTLDKKLAPGGNTSFAGSDSVGNEVDLGLNYAYSEDVNFGLTVGQLYRGDYVKDVLFNGQNSEDPWEALASMTVSF